MAQVQRVRFVDRPPTYTVVGADKLPVAPAREYLTFLRNQGGSPNTLRAYAYGLAAWWTVLEGTGRFTVGGEVFLVSQGETLIMPKDIPHAVYGQERFKMLLTVSF